MEDRRYGVCTSCGCDPCDCGWGTSCITKNKHGIYQISMDEYAKNWLEGMLQLATRNEVYTDQEQWDNVLIYSEDYLRYLNEEQSKALRAALNILGKNFLNN